MDPKLLGILFGIYAFVFPILLRLACHAQKKLIIDRRAQNKKIDPADLPKPWWPKVRERIAFTVKDSRGMKIGKKDGAGPQHRIMFALLWALGLVLWLVGGITVMWQLMLGGFAVFWVCVGFGIRASNDVITARQKLIKRMFDIGRAKLGIPSKFESSPSSVITVEGWDDYVRPNKVTFHVPTTFDMSGEEGFLRQFNQVFGRQTAWVPDDDFDAGTSGWDYDKGQVTLRAVPPLPTRADFSEHYVVNDNIAWSFFPIAIGVENGVELENPQNQETENVLGFDLSGLQSKIKGVTTSPKLSSAAPHALVCGGTGGGKALSTNTVVRVFECNDVVS